MRFLFVEYRREPDRFLVRHEFTPVPPDPCPDLPQFVCRQVSFAEGAVGQGDDRLLSPAGRVKMRSAFRVMVQVQDDVPAGCHEGHSCFQVALMREGKNKQALNSGGTQGLVVYPCSVTRTTRILWHDQW